ncbi:hypothetical protein BGX21_005882 [Mortierella sp. AD011]|nr:hypothetical protein BGX20_004369 [Mortierella sp. AD010]KAF9399633.1 hypothetical protein BGX21_005882 [Mortierella sp. AD011]
MATNNFLNNNIDNNVDHNWNNNNEAQTNTDDQQLASTKVMGTPELVGNILCFVHQSSFVRCSAINQLWRQSVERLPQTYKDFMAMEIAQFESRPKRINIHVLKTVVLQYPTDDHHTHSKPGTYQFVFSCQTRSGSIDNYGESSGQTHSHQHHAHYPGHDHDLQCDYRPSAIISNVYFKTNSPSAESSGVSGPPPIGSSTSRRQQQQEGSSNADISISQLSLSSRTSSPKLRYIPCPYEPTSDSSLDHEDSPPPPNRDTEGMEGSSDAVMPLQGDMSESMDWEQQPSHRHHHSHRHQGKKRHSRTSRNWSMSIQTYYYQRAAMNAMILAARQYMESREAEECSIVEKTDTTRIIWNDSTKQELIWTITSTTMDRANPGDVVERDYDPNWQAQQQ